MNQRTVYLEMISKFLCGLEIMETENEPLVWITEDGDYVKDVSPAEAELYHAAAKEEESWTQ